MIELLVTVSIAAILAGLAVPAFGSLVRDSQRSGAVNDILLALRQARSEGAKRNKPIVICGIADAAGPRCAGHDWSRGWMLAAWDDVNGNGTVDPPELVPVRTFQPSGSARLSVRAGTFTSTPAVQPGGTVLIKGLGRHSSNGTITVCDGRGPGQARAVIVSGTGRARVSSRSASGGPLTCP